MRAIDSHVHLYPPEVNRDPAGWAAAAGEDHWATLCTRRRKGGVAVQAFPSAGQLLREMDGAGVERVVLLGWYWRRAETCAWQNRFFADCIRMYPDRLSAFATLQPLAGREATVAELRRARDDGLIGLGELSPHAQGHGIDDATFREVLALAGEWRLPVNLHVTDPEGRNYPGRVETAPGDFVRLVRDFPKVNFVLAHWGGLLPLRDPESAKLANLFYDTAASPLMYDAGVWSRFLAVVPSTQVLFGSDFPLNLYPGCDAEPAMARFVAEAKAAGATAAIFHGNAKRLFRP